MKLKNTRPRCSFLCFRSLISYALVFSLILRDYLFSLQILLLASTNTGIIYACQPSSTGFASIFENFPQKSVSFLGEKYYCWQPFSFSKVMPDLWNWKRQTYVYVSCDFWTKNRVAKEKRGFEAKSFILHPIYHVRVHKTR